MVAGVGVLVTAVLAALLPLASLTAPAQAADGAALSVPAATGDAAGVAADGTFTLDGHGYGHGHGMSQWGAQGAALQGRTSSQILAFYYPGTTLTTGGPSDLQVWVSADRDNELRVRPSAGLAVTFGTTRRVLPTTYGTATYSAWRVLLDPSSQQRVEGYADGAWRPLHTENGPARFTNTEQLIRLVLPDGTERDYRGSLRARTAGTTLYTVNAVTMQDYLRSVVPSESPSYWRPAALEAQSVAARTYASYQAREPQRPYYDICDTVSCQVYKGAGTLAGGRYTPHEAASTDAAVAVTAGKILLYGGQPAFTQFSASNGGHSSAGGPAYLVAQPDPYDAAGGTNQHHDWTASLSASAIEAKYPSVGSVARLRVLERDGDGEWGGRIEQIAIDGSAGSVTVTGPTFRFAFGLKSEWFQVTAQACEVVRIAGDDRYETSVVEGRAAFPTSDSVVIVSADYEHLADGVVAAPFAFAQGAPVLLTQRSALPDVVARDIAARGTRTAYVIGGQIPIDPAVDRQLASMGVEVVRIAGATRYATAALVAEAMGGSPSTAVIASGDPRHLIDALVAGGPAARLAWPILLTRKDVLPGETAGALARLGVEETYVVGGPIPISDPVVADLRAAGYGVDRLFGANLYETATAIATALEPAVGSDRVLVASGERDNIIDALGGGTFGRLIVLSERAGLRATTEDWLRGRAPYLGVTVLGGPMAVSADAFRDVETAVCG